MTDIDIEIEIEKISLLFDNIYNNFKTQLFNRGIHCQEILSRIDQKIKFEKSLAINTICEQFFTKRKK